MNTVKDVIDSGAVKLNRPMPIEEVEWEAKKAFIKALIQAKKEFKEIKKTEAGVHGSKHADLADVIEATEPALNKYGLITVQGMRGRLLVTKLIHEDGWEECFERELPPAQGNNLNHADGGATTFFRRYDLQAILTIQPSGEDSDGSFGQQDTWVGGNSRNVSNSSGGSISEKQLNRLYAIAKTSGWNVAQVTAFCLDNFDKEPSQLNWKTDYEKVCKYFEETKNDR
jgi:hypothetical protein